MSNILQHSHDNHDHDHGNDVQKVNTPEWKSHLNLIIALGIFLVMMVLEYGFHFNTNNYLGLVIFLFAYYLAGSDVLKLAWVKARRSDFFNEFSLMSIATIGAFSIGAYSEGVAVMIFYSIGEWFQESAVKKAKNNIKALLDIRPDTVTVIRNNTPIDVKPTEVVIGEMIQVKPGEKVALDGILNTEHATFNTAALTGESKPDEKYNGDEILAGMINESKLAEVKVTSLFRDSKLSKILEMVQDATARKSKTQLFISRFAKIYTPIVFALAVLLVVIPSFIYPDYVFTDWLYRGLVFLVISCPCALVVSIPLGYFGGISLASKNGILFKGGNFLDVMSTIDTVVMDKTGTLTKGVFKVQEMDTEMDRNDFIKIVAAIESKSSHPIAKAITQYADGKYEDTVVKDVEEIAGHGLRGTVDGKDVLAGNGKLLRKFNISFPDHIENIVESIVVVAVDKRYAGYITVADEIKEDAAHTISDLKKNDILTIMLSGDKDTIVQKTAYLLGLDKAFGALLPENKVNKVKELKNANKRIAFVGDGVNDAPVIALADVGIAMGGLGSDAAIETADVVIQTDQPSKILSAIKIGKITKWIVWQNIILAMAVKIAVLILGAEGVASLWEAVIADVGVALLAILNAVRIQAKKI
ncbi:heavy metal translocating P-type ATPase [Pseudopedobacter saltans DSM 12145]|uniref:P-type Zn(2+) transporter n=1 Tax=Pseudopedobacter saltans (strain ATCC 51119 / DSM 12145 / JCM 21818 / CCUG 39354 / LMG 10337 / NBRC 100064 / NCIMB 13643) TaxID=762903 RepID=F0SAH1_PSESL|nr:heavy metal translocating P-type ATPase [Pseudopedobacter saltans]ADY52591.1 heavy metal translocating P-type ATPase [Pseudopedobacter saltans DSM 12145]